MTKTRTDRFLSEEDLDLRNISREELIAWWNLWLEQAQITNNQDKDEYSHGVFRQEPCAKIRSDQHVQPPAQRRIQPA